MKFEEVYPAYKEGKTIKCNVHKFNQEESTVIRTDLLDSEDWSICSKIEEYMDKLGDVQCVDFRQDDNDDRFDLNIIRVISGWYTDMKYTPDYELKKITWYVPHETKVHFVSRFHFVVSEKIILKEDGRLFFHGLRSIHDKFEEDVDKIELIYITGESE